MHCCGPFPGRDGQAPSEGYRRSWPDSIHGEASHASSIDDLEVDELGQEYDLRNTPSLEESVRHSDVVYNLVGRDYPTKYGTYTCQ